MQPRFQTPQDQPGFYLMYLFGGGGYYGDVISIRLNVASQT